MPHSATKPSRPRRADAVIVLRRAEEDPPRAAEPDALRHLEVPELARRGERRPGLPAAEVVRPGLPDHAAGVGRVPRRRGRSTASGSGRRRARPTGRARSRARTSACRPPARGPASPSSRGRPTSPGRCAGPRRPPPARCRCRTCASGRRGAGCCRSRSRGRRTRRAARSQRIGQHAPVAQVARDGMPDRRVAMAQLGIAERARRLQVEDVDVLAVAREPEVPQPVAGQPQRHRAAVGAALPGRERQPAVRRRRADEHLGAGPGVGVRAARARPARPEKLPSTSSSTSPSRRVNAYTRSSSGSSIVKSPSGDHRLACGAARSAGGSGGRRSRGPRAPLGVDLARGSG